MRALLKPKVQTPHAREHVVTLLVRTSKEMIVVEGESIPTHAVDRWRLYSVHDRQRRITADEFARLRWRGKGKDPLTLSTARLFEDLEERP